MAILETYELTRWFGKLTAVDALTMSVEAGEIFGLLGPNGAGKTTVLKMLTTLLPPTSGRARVAGFDIVRSPAFVRRQIGYVPQVISADGMLTGYENLLVFAKLYEIPRSERKARVSEALTFMGLTHFADKLVSGYSGGMIRRLEIAQCVLHRPKVLFLDEPTMGLDPLARKAVWQQVLRLRSDYGATIFLTTHYMEEADFLCSRVTIMHRGKAMATGTPADLKKSLPGEKVTLDDVFAYYTGSALESGGSYRDTSRTRRTGRRLG